MKTFIRSILLLLCAVLFVAVLAFRMGWLTWDMLVHRPQPSPTPSVAPSVAAEPSPSPSPARDHTVFRVAIDDRPATLALQALPDFIRSHGGDLQVQLVTVTDARLRWQMLAAGHVDMAVGSLDSFVLANQRQDAGTLVCKVDTSAGTDSLVVAADITSLKELAGKKIAMVAGSGGEYLLGFLLDHVGLSPSDVDTIQVEDVQEAAQLLAARRVQGAWLWPPYTRVPGVHVLESTTNHADILIEICAVNRGTLEKQRNAVLTFMRHWFEFESLLRSNRGIGRELIARATRRSASQVGELLNGVHFFDLAENQKVESEDLINQMRRIQEFWQIMRVPNTANTVDLNHTVKIDLTREIEIQASTSIFGQPSPSTSATPGGAGPSPIARPALPASPSASPSASGSTSSDSPTGEPGAGEETP